jgi:hypothetical protein
MDNTIIHYGTSAGLRGASVRICVTTHLVSIAMYTRWIMLFRMGSLAEFVRGGGRTRIALEEHLGD